MNESHIHYIIDELINSKYKYIILTSIITS